MNWDAYYKQILDRDWVVIRQEWLAHLPSTMTLCARPDPTLAQIVGLADELRGIDRPTLIEGIPGARRVAFAEAIFLYHKGLHVLRAAQRHATNGMPSWSLFSAYHSAYITARC